MASKTCKKCGESKDSSEFYANPNTADGLLPNCKPCHRRAVGRRQRIQRYGITEAQFHVMLKAQGGKCAVCGQPEKMGRALSVDHDHSCCPQPLRSCGRCVRGLLCAACNRALGAFRDDVAALYRAIEYLKKFAQL